VTSGGTSLDAVVLSTGQRLLPVLRGGDNHVEVYCFAKAADLQAFSHRAGAPGLAGAESCRERRYPYFLDFWDRHCQGFWYRLQQNSKGQTDESDMAFSKEVWADDQRGQRL